MKDLLAPERRRRMALEPHESMLDDLPPDYVVMPELPANYVIEEDVIEDNRLGQLLLRFRRITHEQLQECLDEQVLNAQAYLGELLVEKGFVTHDDIQNTLKLQLNELRLGQILVRTGSIQESQLDVALSEQDQSGELLGSVLIGLGFCSPEEIAWALEQQSQEDEAD
jgi:hypothetical protein